MSFVSDKWLLHWCSEDVIGAPPRIYLPGCIQHECSGRTEIIVHPSSRPASPASFDDKALEIARRIVSQTTAKVQVLVIEAMEFASSKPNPVSPAQQEHDGDTSTHD